MTSRVVAITPAITPAITIAMALGVSSLPGCALLSAAKVDDTRTFMLKPLAPDLPDLPQARHCTAATLLVFPPRAQAIYDTTQMAYTTQAHQIAHFARHEWADTPSRTLLPLLVRALQNTRCFNPVVTPPYTYHYTQALRTDLVELLQDFTSQPATLRLVLRAQLSDDATSRVIASREVVLREPLSQETAEAGVIAANRATARALQEVVTFVLAATSSSRSRP
jgi:cholesterol transport system auxiliary component